MRALAVSLALLLAAGPAGAQQDAINSAIGEAAGPSGEAREAYPVTDEAVSALRIILGRPLPGETCRDALFDARPLVRTRFEASAGDALALELGGLCLVEFRNDAPDRTLELRVGEDLATLAITADQRLFRGLTLVPNQTTTVPLRHLPVGRLDVPVDVFWSGTASRADVQTFTLSFVDR
ncbi:hypothetical protein DLJ53_28175 [Acuticoccus sediminis]|uniref:Uncharacterized protein n=1 Tax=Acuticoccus sediminis TaxID=2184697 RepID=A0A8B2NI54_9HYPH|nr:hypothetical protein [Acuticoccus sediminis]RAH97724.1 hypothetical protein DLJ53_28175 [Acuticoccus sediminis]